MTHPFKLKCRCGTDLEPQWTQAEGDGTCKVTPVPARVVPFDLPVEDPSGSFDPLIWASSPQDVDQSWAGRQTDHDLITRQGVRTDWGSCTPRGQSPGPDPPPPGRAFPYLPMPQPDPRFFAREGLPGDPLPPETAPVTFPQDPDPREFWTNLNPRGRSLLEPHWEWFWRQGMSAQARISFRLTDAELADYVHRNAAARLAREAAERDTSLREEQP